jgi:hypothetical protein
LQGKIGEREHLQFVRFGKGKFDGRAALTLQKVNNIKLRGSFEYANDFVYLAAELNAKFSGLIMSKEDLGLNGKKKSGLFVYEVSALSSEKIKEIKEKVYCMLLDAEGDGMGLKMKKKLPKPGKSGDLKIDDKFCILEADLKYWTKIKEYFNLPEVKKLQIRHSFIVDNIILPTGEKDPVKLRLNAKRKGKIERKIVIDKQEKVETFNFEA